MKNLIETLNQDMRDNGDMFQITRVEYDQVVSIEVGKLAEMIVDLVFSSDLQDKIQKTHIGIESEEQYLQDNMDDELWYAPSWSNKDRVLKYMSIYKDFKAEELKGLEDDEDIPF